MLFELQQAKGAEGGQVESLEVSFSHFFKRYIDSLAFDIEKLGITYKKEESNLLKEQR